VGLEPKSSAPGTLTPRRVSSAQHRWRRATGPDSEILPPEAYL